MKLDDLKEYQLPKYCDLSYEYAEFPKEDLSGAKSCRTFDVLYCSLLERNVLKNSKCEARLIKNE